MGLCACTVNSSYYESIYFQDVAVKIIIPAVYEVWRGEVYCFQVVRDSIIPSSLPFNILRTTNRITPNFAYSMTLTGSRLGQLRVHFCKFTTQLWPMVIVRISIPPTILRRSQWSSVNVSQIYNTGIAHNGIHHENMPI